MPNLRPREYGTVASFSSPSPGASTSPSLLSLRRVNELGLLSAVHLGAPCEPLFTLQVTGEKSTQYIYLHRSSWRQRPSMKPSCHLVKGKATPCADTEPIISTSVPTADPEPVLYLNPLLILSWARRGLMGAKGASPGDWGHPGPHL